MATAPATLVLRHVRNLVAAEQSQRRPDRELLEQFVGKKVSGTLPQGSRHLFPDQERAFEMLVRRHGPLVLGVCRRVLGNWHDAEDAFQATFLVLARKAGAIAKQDSIGSWLYQVAYHMAIRAKHRAMARQVQERKADRRLPADPLAEVSARELLAVVDEEVQQLPERYRAAVVLCYLEGQTRDQAAQQLGWSLSTLQRRLEEARERLRRRLTRRGVTWSAGLLAAILSERTASAMPLKLVGTTVKAAVGAAAGKGIVSGGISASALALADGAIKAMAATKFKIATAMIVALAVAGLGIGTLTHQAVAARRAEGAVSAPPPAGKQDTPDTAPKPANAAVGPQATERQTMTLTGRVLDPNGKPVPKADVAVLARLREPLRLLSTATILVKGQTDADGHFRLTMRHIPRERYWSMEVVARGGLFGLGWHHLNEERDWANPTIRLVPEQVLHGRLIDLQGQPADGVRVCVVHLQAVIPKKDALYIDFLAPPEDLPCWPEPVITNKDGRFSLRGMAHVWQATIQVRDNRFAAQNLDLKPGEKGQQQEITVALNPARLIEGTVTYEDTQKPAAHARLVVNAGEDMFGPYQPVECRADEKGRYRVIPPVGKEVTVLAYPPAGQPYLLRRKTFTWAKGSTHKQGVDLTLRRGIAVEGRITETPSGKPVAGATVQFLWRSDNPFARDDLNVFVGGVGLEQIGVSEADGKFQLPILPGSGHLVIKGPTADYLHTSITTKELYGPGVTHIRNPHYPDAVVALNLKPDQRSHKVAVTLRRGITLKGEIVGPDGKPVSQASILCDFYIPEDYHQNPAYPLYARDGRFELPGCDPAKESPVFFYDPKSQAGAVVKLPGRHAGEKNLKIRLHSCGQATARFVDEKGKPVAGLRCDLHLIIKLGDSSQFSADTISTITASYGSLDWVRSQLFLTDNEGRATFPGLIPGAKHQVLANVGGMRGYRIVSEFTAESGRTVDLKTIQLPSTE